jgi:uncharacterized protein (TIGR02646 family)
MHLLNRDPISPSCLNGRSHPPNSWKAVYNEDAYKDEIWQKIESMQGKRCAYCENSFSGLQRHIDHFRPRSRFPQDTFNWFNLFGSCSAQNSCGNHKDAGTNLQPNYNPDDLIKPDVDDPAEYLMFSSDGSVTPKAGLLPVQIQKAQLTIDVFGLNGSLRQVRETVLIGYKETAEYFLVELRSQMPAEDWQSLYQDKLREIETQPFCTAIKQLFLP